MNADDILKHLYSTTPTPVTQQAVGITENFKAGRLNEIEYKELMQDLQSQLLIEQAARSEEEREYLNQLFTAVINAASLISSI
jgi:ribosomal protein S13